MIDLDRVAKMVSCKNSERLILVKQRSTKRQQIKELEQRMVDLEEARDIVIEVSQNIQQEAYKQISSVVSECLELVFSEPYTFLLDFERKYEKTFVNLVFERNGEKVDPLTASGGGVVDVAAFALRLSCLMLSKPKLRKLLVLDEPFKFVSKDYRDNVRIMLETLSERLGVQVIMVTHDVAYETGKIIEV